MRILLSNDDGVHATGLKVLERIATAISDDVWIVAPETDQSGVSHSFSLSNPLRLREVGPRHFAVQGTPTDSVIMAVRQLMQDKKPDLLLSGVNRGQNVAEDVTYSGTIAAAMEGTLLGIPSMAVSLSYGGPEGRDKPHWGCVETHAPAMIKKIVGPWRPPGSAHQHQFSRLRGERGSRRRVHFAGTAQCRTDAHRAAPRWARAALLLVDVQARELHRGAGLGSRERWRREKFP